MDCGVAEGVGEDVGEGMADRATCMRVSHLHAIVQLQRLLCYCSMRGGPRVVHPVKDDQGVLQSLRASAFVWRVVDAEQHILHEAVGESGPRRVAWNIQLPASLTEG